MPRWITWMLCVGGGIVAGAFLGPCLMAAIGELMGPDAKGPGFLGYLVGFVVGPVVCGIVGAVIAWNVTHADDDDEVPADAEAHPEEHAIRTT